MATTTESESVKPRTSDVKDTAEHHEISDDDFTWSPEEEKQLLRKIDTFLMPTIWVMYLLSYMDRTK